MFHHRSSFAARLVIAMLICAAGFQPLSRAAAPGPPPFPPPIPLITRSPIELFRDLLATNDAGRAEILAARTPEQRKSIEAKLNEYLALPTDQRELRLCVTELRWYLLPLLRLNVTNRPAYLNQVPAAYRPLLEDRVTHWDKMPADLQQEFLKNEAALHIILRYTNSISQDKPNLPAGLSELQRQRMDDAFACWRSMTQDRRDAVTLHFNRFFDLGDGEKKRVLNALTPPERQQMERTLARFALLPDQDRQKCVASFDKFASMPLEDREQFLQNAARWIEMTPEERQAWRILVHRLRPTVEPPPLPPGLVPFPIAGGSNRANSARK